MCVLTLDRIDRRARALLFMHNIALPTPRWGNLEF